MNRLKTTFLKNCELKTQKSVYSNRRQCDAFLKTQYFKRLNCDFAKRLIAFLKITFLNRTFKIVIFEIAGPNRPLIKIEEAAYFLFEMMAFVVVYRLCI
jgi:hypothetical protein